MMTRKQMVLGGAALAVLAVCGDLQAQDIAVRARPVAEKKAEKVELEVADFELKDTAGKVHKLSDYVAEGKTVILEWFNPDCPFVRAQHDPQSEETPSRMQQTFGAVKGRDVVWLAINSGAEGKQGAGLERNKEAVADWKLPYPVLLDMDGRVGRAYGAATTPHMFVITPKGKLAYQGAIDDSGGRGEVKTNYVVATMKALRAGEEVEVTKTKSFGCSVKYGKEEMRGE